MAKDLGKEVRVVIGRQYFPKRTKYLEGEVERVNHGACFKLICLEHGEKSTKEHLGRVRVSKDHI